MSSVLDIGLLGGGGVSTGLDSVSGCPLDWTHWTVEGVSTGVDSVSGCRLDWISNC